MPPAMPPPPRDNWEEFLELLPESIHRLKLKDFQLRAIVFGALTVLFLVFGLVAGMDLQLLGPLVALPGVQAAKHIRHWIEWRRENPHVRATPPDERRVLEEQTVKVMSDAVRARAWITWAIIAAVTVPSMAQLWTGLEASVAVASVDREAILGGQWWRLLSGTYLHGSYYHFSGNMGALLLYGAVLESKTSRLRLPLVYLLACLAGSLASVLVPPHGIPSIGASGGVVGVIAYLFVFSRRQRVKFPAAFRGATATVFFSLIVAGAFGFWYIDNPGHAGGALMGFLLAGLIVDTAQSFIGELEQPLLDLLGGLALLVLVAGAAQTLQVLLAV